MATQDLKTIPTLPSINKNTDKLLVNPQNGKTSQITASTFALATETYNKTDVDNALALKANTTDVNNALALKANLASPALTGTPTAPTAPGGTNTTQLATTQFVKSEIASTIASLDVLVFKGVIDASTNPNYPAGDAGNTYRISVAGKIGGASGINVEVGDLLLCLVDGSPAGNQASVGANWNISQVNIDGAVTSIETSTTDGDLVVFSGTSGKEMRKTTAPTFKTSLSLVKADVGLGNVDNTSDLNKPVSTATQNALNLKQDALGFTPENVANKTSSYTGTSTALYTNQKAVNDGLLTKVDTNAISQIGWTTKLPTISINETTRVITLAVTNPNTSYDFYSQNQLFSKTSSEQVVFSNTEGVHLVYYDANGNLIDATSNFDFIIQNFATVTTFYWSVSQAKIIIGALNELHSSQTPPALHYENHKTFGTRFVDGLLLSMNATGDGSLASHAQFSGASGNLDDDGLILPISAKALTDNFPLIYKSGVNGNFVEVNPRTNFITTTGVNGRAVYNQNNAGTWQLTELNNNDYGITYIYATTGLTTQYFGVITQSTYSNLTDARNAVKIAPDLGALPSAEYKLIGAILFQTASSYTNAVKTKIIPIDDNGTTYQDFRRVSGIGAPASVSTGDLAALYNALATKQAIATLGADVSANITNDINSNITKSLSGQSITLNVKDKSITNAKLADNAVDGNILADNSVTNNKIPNGANIATGKLQQATITPVNAAATNNDTQETINNKLQGQVNQNKNDITGLSNTKLDKTGGTITGDLIINGNATINGTTTIVNSETVEVKDKNIEIGKVATPTDTTADGGGFTLKGATDKTFNWLSANQSWNSSENINLPSGKDFRINNVKINEVAETLKNKAIDGLLNTFTNIPWAVLKGAFQNVYYVHGINGNDANNGFTPDTAFKTISQANAAIGNAKAFVFILEGTSENLTITNTNVSFSSYGSTQTGQISLTGVVTVNSTSVISFQGISFTSLNHTGTGSLYLDNCSVSTAFTTTSSGYLKVVNTSMQNATVSITGSSYKTFCNQSIVGTLTINNANTIVTITDSTCQNGITLTAGLCNVNNSDGFIAGTTSNFLVSESASTIVFNNVKLQNTDGTPAKIQIKAGALYWINNLVYNATTSSILGTNVNIFTTRFTNTYTDTALINDLTANILKFTGATADRALIYTGGQIATSSVTKANLETLLAGGNLNKLSNVTSATTDNYKVLTIKNDASGEYDLQLPVKNLTTTQRDALTNVPSGFIIYNSTDDKFQSYNGTAWSNIVAAGTGNVSVTGLTNASGKAPVFNNANGTGLALLDTTVALDKLNYSKSTGSIPVLSTTERNNLVAGLQLTNGDTIVNSTTGTIQTLRSGTWYEGLRDSTEYVNFISSGINGGGTLLGNASWSSTSGSGKSTGVVLTTNNNNQKGIWYKNIVNIPKRIICTTSFVVGGGNGADGMWYSFFASSIPTTSNDITTANNSYTIFFNEYNSSPTFGVSLYYNGTQLKYERFTSVDYGGADHVKNAEIKLYYDPITDFTRIVVTLVGTYGGSGLAIDYQDNVSRNLTGTYCIVGAKTGGFNNYHTLKDISISNLYE